jgi:micrococcal nuclease
LSGIFSYEDGMHRAGLIPYALVFVAGLSAGLVSHGTITHKAQAAPDIPAAEPQALPPAGPVPKLALGTYAAEVTRIIDGDTVEARVAVWMGQDVVTKVRLRGIDAPEIRGACGQERDRAIAARDALVQLVGGRPVTLAQIGPDKYFGRVVARLVTSDGRDAGAVLVADGLARSYGGKRRDSWCAIP